MAVRELRALPAGRARLRRPCPPRRHHRDARRERLRRGLPVGDGERDQLPGLRHVLQRAGYDLGGIRRPRPRSAAGGPGGRGEHLSILELLPHPETAEAPSGEAALRGGGAGPRARRAVHRRRAAPPMGVAPEPALSVSSDDRRQCRRPGRGRRPASPPCSGRRSPPSCAPWGLATGTSSSSTARSGASAGSSRGRGRSWRRSWRSSAPAGRWSSPRSSRRCGGSGRGSTWPAPRPRWGC